MSYVQEIQSLQKDKLKMTQDYIKLKKNYQKLFFKFKEMEKVNIDLREEVVQLKAKSEKKNIMDDSNMSILHNENQSMRAQIKQLHRLSVPQKSEENTDSCEFEVEKIVKHRRRYKKLEFLVHWKGYSDDEDTWSKECNLQCPQILNAYKKMNKL